MMSSFFVGLYHLRIASCILQIPWHISSLALESHGTPRTDGSKWSSLPFHILLFHFIFPISKLFLWKDDLETVSSGKSSGQHNRVLDRTSPPSIFGAIFSNPLLLESRRLSSSVLISCGKHSSCTVLISCSSARISSSWVNSPLSCILLRFFDIFNESGLIQPVTSSNEMPVLNASFHWILYHLEYFFGSGWLLDLHPVVTA